MTKRILIVDDDAAVRRAFRLALDSQGYEIVEAENGKAGVAKALEQDFDLVYLDLRMPDMNGVEVLRRIRVEKPDLIVYIVTAFHRDFFDDLVTARGEGMRFELLRKPLESEQLVEITAGILSEDNSGAHRWY